jgi:mannobiose 2-epimerase
VELRHQAQRCRRLLDSSVIKFYLPACIDTTNGGYLENWREGKFIPTGEKFLTQQARNLWFFSTLVQEGIATEPAKTAAKTGFAFLQSRFLDREQGGYFSKVTDAGQVKDPRKHVYLNSFALYALAAYYRATKDPAALEAAQKLTAVLEIKARDMEHGGFVEFFHRDWRPITDPKEPIYVGPVGAKTYNTHLHLLESYAELYRAWPDPHVKSRLVELVLINTITVRHSTFFCNIDAWHRDWRIIQSPRNLRASYGHDVECAWLVLDALRTMNLPTGPLQPWAQSLVDYSMKYGYDRHHGGFFYGGPLGQAADESKKEWWVQAEALVGLLELYRLTKDPQYYAAFRQTLDFVEKHQAAPGGGWFATCKSDGTVQTDTRSSMWQGPYHCGRALLRCAKLLEELSPRQSP